MSDYPTRILLCLKNRAVVKSDLSSLFLMFKIQPYFELLKIKLSISNSGMDLDTSIV